MDTFSSESLFVSNDGSLILLQALTEKTEKLRQRNERLKTLNQLFKQQQVSLRYS